MKYIFSLLIFLASCGGKSYTHVADPIISSYTKEMRYKRGYWINATGGSMPKSDVRNIHISFVSFQEVDITVSRRLFIELVEGLVDKMNTDLAIRPYLHDYPSTYKNANVHLSFYDRKDNPVSENHIALVLCVDDTIYYAKFNHKTCDFETVFSEPYEVALESM